MRQFFILTGLACLLVTGAAAQEMPGLKAGVVAPDFTATNFKGEEVALSSLYKEGPVVLVFYRGSWCPYCNVQLQQLQARLADFKTYNASVVAVSVDKIDNAAKAVDGNELEFEVISNPEGDILEQYGLMYKVPDDLNKVYKEQYNIDLEAASGRMDHVIAIPATYIIDQNGMITFAYADEDYKVRTSPDEIMAELEKL